MYYTDTLLFQGADPDGIADATSRLLAVLHGINRAHGEHGDQNGKKGNYPLSIAFPRWQSPTMSAHRRLSGGSTGPILRIFGSEPLLDMINQHRLMQSLVMEGRADAGKILSLPGVIDKWVSYRRYHRQEKAVSKSYQRRHALFLERKKQLNLPKPTEQAIDKPEKSESFIYLKILRPDGGLLLLPVQEKIISVQQKPDEALQVNSWGLTTTGVLPYF